jgi:hypothetical protein
MRNAIASLALIKVNTQGGEEHDIETPLDIRTSDFLDELRPALKLAANDAEGRTISWRLDNKDTGQTLVGNLTLEENDVRPGHRLNLIRSVVAGAQE